jgi:hypothetical protein
MLKIIVVLATTFVFAGLLIAHPYTSPSVELASDSPKAKAPAQAQVAASVKVPQTEQAAKPAPQQDALVATNPHPAPVASRPAAPVRPAVQPESQTATVGTLINQAISTITVRPPASTATPAVRQPTYAGTTPAAGKRTDGRHWSQADSQRMKADAIRAQDDAMPGQAGGPVQHRPASTTRHVEYRRGY